MKKIFYIVPFLFLFISCSTTPHLPDYVCDYTNLVCEYSDLVCEVYPQSCWYVKVACLNLNALCDSTLTEDQILYLKKSLQINNDLMKKFLSQKNEGVK